MHFLPVPQEKDMTDLVMSYLHMPEGGTMPEKGGHELADR